MSNSSPGSQTQPQPEGLESRGHAVPEQQRELRGVEGTGGGEVVGRSWRTEILKVQWPKTAPVETSLSMNVCLIGKERREGGRKRLMCLYEAASWGHCSRIPSCEGSVVLVAAVVVTAIALIY